MALLNQAAGRATGSRLGVAEATGLLLHRNSGQAGTAGLAVGGRFDAIERHNEVLRRAMADMDQGLRREILS